MRLPPAISEIDDCRTLGNKPSPRGRGVGVRGFSESLFDRVPDLVFEGQAVEAVDLLQARGRGDVDLGQVIADDVDADENEAAALQLGADDLADLLFALGEGRFHGLARRHACCCAPRPRRRRRG